MTSTLSPWLILFLAAAATFLWRGMGVLLSLKVDPGGRIFHWVSCLSFALIAALVSRMILVPTGSLAETATIDRVLPVLIGLGAAFLFNRNVLVGVITGTLAFIGLAMGRDAGLWPFW